MRITSAGAVLLVLALAAPVTLEAQQSTNSFGFGLGLQELSIVGFDEGATTRFTPLVYVPIMVSERMMLEPGIGYTRLNTSIDSDFGSQEETTSVLQLNAGLLFMIVPADRGRVYAGPRVGIVRFSVEQEFDGASDEFKRTDLFLAGVLGGEFFLLPAFSLGGEASLNYLRMGEPDTDGDTGAEVDGSLISLGAEFRVRWYIR